MTKIIPAFLIVFLLSAAAMAYNPINAQVLTRASDPETKEVIFQVRNNSLLPMTGFYYEIRLFNQNNQRVLTPFGEVFQGYQDFSLPAGERREARVILSQINSPIVRAQVILTLVCTMRRGETHIY